jgi:protein-disulfide isomerase
MKRQSPPRGLLIFFITLGVLVIAALVGVIMLSRQIQADNTPATAVRSARPRPTALPNLAISAYAQVPLLRATDIVFGNPKAPVLIYEYSDLECPFCRQMQQIFNTIIPQYGEKVAVVYRQFPLTKHEQAHMESEVLLCVARDDMDEARRLIALNFTRTSSTGNSFTQDQYLDLAAEAGARRSTVADCLEKKQTSARVDSEIAEGKALGVSATPTSFIVVNGNLDRVVKVDGAIPSADWQQAIDYLLP